VDNLNLTLTHVNAERSFSIGEESRLPACCVTELAGRVDPLSVSQNHNRHEIWAPQNDLITYRSASCAFPARWCCGEQIPTSISPLEHPRLMFALREEMGWRYGCALPDDPDFLDYCRRLNLPFDAADVLF
jgi:hypothetical protein